MNTKNLRQIPVDKTYFIIHFITEIIKKFLFNEHMSEELQKKIEKPWAVYGTCPKFIGRIINESGICLEILSIEGQLYPAWMWDSKYVERFNTSEEVINYLNKYNCSKSELRNILLDRFPEALRAEYLQTFHDLLFFHKNNLIAQTSP